MQRGDGRRLARSRSCGFDYVLPWRTTSLSPKDPSSRCSGCCSSACRAAGSIAARTPYPICDCCPGGADSPAHRLGQTAGYVTRYQVVALPWSSDWVGCALNSRPWESGSKTGAIAAPTSTSAVLKACWTEARPSFEGRYLSFPPSAVEPKCVQQPHVPLWIGGNGPRPERRAVEHGDGWAPLTGTFAARAEAIARIRARAAAAGARSGTGWPFRFGGLSIGPVDVQSACLGRATM